MNSIRLIWPLLLVAAAPALAQAPQKTDPPAYDSAFAAYRAYQEPTPAPWKDTNDKLRQAPGHAMSGMRHDAAPAAAKPDPHHAHHHKE